MISDMANGNGYMDGMGSDAGAETIGNVRCMGRRSRPTMRPTPLQGGQAVVGIVPTHGRLASRGGIPSSHGARASEASDISSLIDVSTPDEYVQAKGGSGAAGQGREWRDAGSIGHVPASGRSVPRSVRPLSRVSFASDENSGRDVDTTMAMSASGSTGRQQPRDAHDPAPADGEDSTGTGREGAISGDASGQGRPMRAVRGVLAVSCAMLGMASLGIGYMTILVPDGGTTAGATVMSQTADLGEGSKGEADSGDAAIDWEGLRKRNPDLRAWMRVSSDGTDISQPVVYPSGGKASGWYLKHGFDNESTLLGVPFIDQRDGDKPGNLNLLVYGHHFAGSTKMFSSLNRANEQASFDKVSSLTWSTEDGGDETYVPVMAMAVDKTYQKVQRFGITDTGYLRTWLRSMEGDATAKAEDADAIIAKATKVVTTVTCESDQPNEPGRVLVVFAKVG